MKALLQLLVAVGASMALAGNEGGGGGDGFQDHVLAQSEIEFYLKSNEFRYLAEGRLYGFMSVRVEHRDENEPLNRAFSKMDAYGEANLAVLINDFNLRIESNDSCYDRTGDKEEPRDASVDIANREICFSSQRLVQREYTIGSARRNITALLLHEISHFAGTNEDEARALQIYLNSEHNFSIIYTEKIDILYSVLDNGLILDEFISREPNLSPTEICMSIGEVYAEASNLIEKVYGSMYGVFMIRPDSELRTVISTLYSTYAAFGFCLNTRRAEYDLIFEEEAGGQHDFTDQNGYLITYAQHLNRDHLRANLNVAKQTLVALQEYVRRSSLPGDCEIGYDYAGGERVVECYLSKPIDEDSIKSKKSPIIKNQPSFKKFMRMGRDI